MLRAFQNLGEMTTKYWSQLGGTTKAFPEAAASALANTKVLLSTSAEEVFEWLARSPALPEQYGKDFGQPPINVYVADGFYIQVLVWIDGTTAIHEHAFVGAFGVLAGSSVHTQYRFDMQTPLAPELRLGNITFLSSELLRRGDIREINTGSEFIHALFHLDRPSVSVVIRSPFLPQSTQYSYIKPHVAFDPYFEDMSFRVKLRLLESLRLARFPNFLPYATALLEHGGPLIAFKVLMETFHASKDLPRDCEQLVDIVLRKFGHEAVEQFVASIKDDERSRTLTRLRAHIKDRDYRFFLALLLNVPQRNTLLKLVSREFPTETPELLITKWIRGMAEARVLPAEVDPALLAMTDFVAQHGSFPKARAAVLKQMPTSSDLRDENKMKKLWEAARCIPLFTPLFD